MKMKKYFKGYSSLYIILGVAAVALLFGFLVIRKRINTPYVAPQQQTEQKTDETPQVDSEVPQTSNITGWLTYTNDKHGFQLLYPPSLKVGAISSNSVLGTFQVPVKGFHVGPLVFVVLKDATVKQQANDYFNESYDLALHPIAPAPGVPAEACTIDKITNTSVVSVKSVSCTGEGGAARYAYIKGKDYDVFVDGYSKGYDKEDYGKFNADSDYVTILGTFKFTTTAAAATTTSTAPNATNSADQPPPTSIKTFSITADDSGATPSEISVASGTIVEITFIVSSSNVYYGGLDFRSSVINSGTIYSGQSKTISFTATKPFSFTPYWPSSNVAKSYKINVKIQ